MDDSGIVSVPVFSVLIDGYDFVERGAIILTLIKVEF